LLVLVRCSPSGLLRLVLVELQLLQVGLMLMLVLGELRELWLRRLGETMLLRMQLMVLLFWLLGGTLRWVL
jgi:hypothetical protein